MFKRPTIAAATIAINIMAVGVAFAQQTTPTPAQPPARDSSAMGGMMQGGGVMPMMGMMDQMSKMMENCNRMMQSSLQWPESSPSQQQPTQQPPQGNHG
jgi:hypothetical protein